MAYSFLFGGDTKETPESIKRKRDLAMAIMGASAAPKNVGEGLNALGSGIVAGIMNRRANKAEGEGRSAADDLFNQIIGQAPNASASSMPSPGVNPASSGASGATASAGPVNMSGNDIYSGFMDTVDDSITNPFGLAAVAATGQAESRFSPKNVNRTWSDPSESGQAGTAGGIMSWRGPRLEKLQGYAASKGEQGNGSPQTQAEFLLQEDPNLVTALNNAKSVEEAQQLMNRAWQFAGWNRPGGEAAERLATASAFLPKFQGQGQPQQVASLDPSVGMPPQTASEAVTAMAAGSPGAGRGASASASPFAPPSLTEEVAEFEKTPEYAARFPGQNVGPKAGLRPFNPGETRPNADGSFSTELTTTWQLPSGEWVNVPSLWMGPNGPQQFNPEDERGILGAMQAYEAQSGPAFARYGSQEEAVAAARARSNAGGAGAGPQAGGVAVGGVGASAASADPAGLPSPFDQSAQLANAQGGIMPALVGGTPATEEQLAQARARGGAQPQSQPQGAQGGLPGVDPALLQALSNPFLSDEQRAVVQAMVNQQYQTAEAAREQQVWLERQRYEQEAKRSDPSYQMGLEKTRLELEEARKPKRQPLINAGNGNVYDPNEDKWLTPPTGGGNGQFRFSGNSVEAQALNGLMDSNQLTPEQAQQLAAGKTISGPNGEVIFLTPQGVFGQPAAGGQPQQLSGGQPAPQSQPQPGQQQAQPGGRLTPEGNIQVTAPKVTVDEKEAATFADRMNNSGSLIDKFENAGLGVWDQAVRGNDYIPDFLENWMVSDDFQKFDQARRDFINAQLRRESGAVISPEEFDNANKQYFPQPNDLPDVLEQKRRNRQIVIDGMKRAAGPTYGNKSGEKDDPLGIR
ncbi:hypothetical protein SFHH103_00148 [Sinorhizobium fredii HH103]|uniref:Phage tail lysozyme domain-containing protein n=1 Tax=Sinorhizobium fredii (strain HH103) TaxID=1117943 RepID=G9AA61_SINF1|nr:phage tail tip lysozyme [Sinorhizobium fredii]CCE94652.1 hypothetical protein SFHH103_00148 [Sinorhizobium fredii HH103]